MAEASIVDRQRGAQAAATGGSWPSGEEGELAGAARRLLDRGADSTAVRRVIEAGSVDLGLWDTLVTSLAVPGLAVAESFGGSGGDLGTLAVIAEEVGRRVAPVPWLASVLAADVLAEAGATKELERVLAGAPVAVAVELDSSEPAVPALGPGDSLTGILGTVPHAEGAELLIIPVHAGGSRRLAVVEGNAAGVTTTRLSTLDLTRPQARVQLDGVTASLLELPDPVASLARLQALGTVLVSAEQLGGARWSLATATDYAKNREQFGVPIGTFQAVKHLLADQLVALELASCLLAEAVVRARDVSSLDDPVTAAAVAAAAAACAELGPDVTAATVQVLGGTGFTWEHDAHLYFRRARASAVLVGGARLHRDRLGVLVATPGELRAQSASPADPELADFRARAATWLGENARLGFVLRAGDEQHEREHLARAVAFQRSMHAAGLAGITWPTEVGGLGLRPEFASAFADETRGREMFTDVFSIALGMCGPVLIALGSAEQRTHLPAMLRADELWCQLFSEPGAGSDLAALRTRAERQHDGSWVVNGQKVWTTFAHASHYGLLLARTDPDAPKHRGITMFVVDMHAPGVMPRPLRQMTGEREFNEVFLDNVRLPADSVVGTVGGGWQAAMTMLMNERVTLGRDPLTLSSPVDAERVRELVRARGLDSNPAVRQRLAEIWSLQRSLELLGNRIAADLRAGDDPGPFASIGKLGAASLATRTVAFAAEIAGPAAAAWSAADDDAGLWAYGLLFSPALGIAGGTNQIQRSIIGERLLGLPR